MKRRLYFIIVDMLLSIYPFLCIHAQNNLRAGDKLEMEQLVYKNFPQPKDGTVLWNMGNVTVLNKKVKKIYWEEQDSDMKSNISCLFDSNKFQYSQTDDSLKLMGMSNHSTEFKYVRPVIVVTYPLKKGNNNSGLYFGKGLSSNGNVLFEYGNYAGECNKEGTLITCDHDTLENTVLLHFRQTVCLEALKLINLNEQDSLRIYSNDEIKKKMMNDSSILNYDIYCWYSPGYRYPVLESRLVSNRKRKVLFSTSYYLSPEKQSEMDDFDNEQIRKNIIKKKEIAQKSESLISVSSGSVLDKESYDLVDKDNCIALSYKITDVGSVNVKYGIFTVDGKLVKQCEDANKSSGIYQDSIDISGFKPNVYLFMLSIGGKTAIVKLPKE